MAVIHTWVARGYCSGCERYFWTTPGSPNVRCACGLSAIVDHVLTNGGQAVTSAYDFRQAVIVDTGLASEDLDLTHEEP